MENLEIINTKTCKTCNETKDLLKFPTKGLNCKICKNNQERIYYFLKKKITVLPKKRKKYNSSEERKAMKLIYNRNRDKHNSQILSDEYIKEKIRSKFYYHKIIPDLSKENIIITRERIKQKRLIKISDKKECKNCKNILEKTYFLKTSSSLCKKCYHKRHYIKYARKPYTYETGQIAKKRYHKNKENLTEGYIKRVIISNLKNYKLCITNSDISDNHVELKRKELTLKRKIKNENKQRSS